MSGREVQSWHDIPGEIIHTLAVLESKWANPELKSMAGRELIERKAR